ncbi:MAG: hypothetical protein IKL02_02525, partial [Kiritimatiellae bacterium]|nr:hypothetical protein [Kiritimatiellia bacterium]
KTCEHADIARRLKTQAHMSTCLQVVVVLIGCQRSIQIKKNCSHYTCPHWGKVIENWINTAVLLWFVE